MRRTNGRVRSCRPHKMFDKRVASHAVMLRSRVTRCTCAEEERRTRCVSGAARWDQSPFCYARATARRLRCRSPSRVIDTQTGASAPALGSAISGSVTYDPDAALLFLGGSFSDWSPASAASLTAVVGGTPYSATPPVIDEYIVHSVPVLYPNIPLATYDDLAIAAASPTLTLYFLDDTASVFSTFNALPASLSSPTSSTRSMGGRLDVRRLLVRPRSTEAGGHDRRPRAGHRRSHRDRPRGRVRSPKAACAYRGRVSSQDAR